MTRTASIRCGSVRATASVAAALARFAAPGQLVVLSGALGAGKTTFAKAYAAALGVTAPVTSPSFTLVHHYRCGSDSPVPVLLHADMWRLEDPAEVADLSLDEPLAEGAAALVEWGDRFEAALPPDRVVVRFRVLDDESRELTVDLGASSVPDTALEALS